MIEFKSIFVLSLLSCFVIVKCDIERKLNVTLNPQCMDPSLCENSTLVYITSESSEDMIHYIWDFTGIPGFLIAKTDLNTTLNINWKEFMSGKEDTVNFSTNPHYVFAAVIPSVKIFDDPSDKANIADETVKNVTSLNPHYFVWHRENLTESEESAVLIMRAFMNDNKNSSIALRVSVNKLCEMEKRDAVSLSLHFLHFTHDDVLLTSHISHFAAISICRLKTWR